MLPYNRDLKQPSRQLRTNVTEPERHLWAKIRRKQLKGCQFYRQKPIGEYIVDFYCHRAKLVVEVDGDLHFSDEAVKNDRVRDEYLSSLGLRVLRFTNAEVMGNIEGVVERIASEVPAVGESPSGNPPWSPFAKGGNGTSPFGKEPAPGLNRRRTRLPPSPFGKGR